MVDRIELLDKQDGRTHFDCGNHALNVFLRDHAGQQQRRGVGKTYVTLRDGLPDIFAHLPRYPVPILRVGRLAVDSRYQKQGIGQDLLSFALNLAIEFSARVGLYAVVVDAKCETAAHFYQRLGFTPTLDNPLCLYISISQLIRARST